VARRRPELLVRSWPALEGRALDIAVGKLAELSGDSRVIDGLLVDLQRGAERAWARVRSQEVDRRSAPNAAWAR
jgi:hypothetical protein